ncbi:MAG: RHS repeat-associated core domain-containing protein, partial [Nitrososphaeraceae archaeon]
ITQTTYTFEAFGKTAITGTSTSVLQYTGRENDRTGLYYYRARYYAPLLSRFISEDPIRFESRTTNLYGYVHNDPVNLVDPLGLKPPPDVPPDVDICKNIRETERLPGEDWIDKVAPDGEWDYKKTGSVRIGVGQ